MGPRNDVKQVPKAPEARREEPKPRLQILKLEERIAPGMNMQHNETLVRDPAQAKRKTPTPRKGGRKGRFRIARLEERIAPKPIPTNHNETLVRDRSPHAR